MANQQHRGSLRHYGLLSVLLVIAMGTTHAAPYSSTWVKCTQSLETAIKLSSLTCHEAQKLLKDYMDTHGFESDDPDVTGVPEVTITGSTPQERLQSIYTGTRLFQWHICKVAGHNHDLSGASDMNAAQVHLDHLSTQTKKLLKVLYQTPPIEETIPEVTWDGDYQKKLYGLAVLARHKELSWQVRMQLEDLQKQDVCNKLKEG